MLNFKKFETHKNFKYLKKQLCEDVEDKNAGKVRKGLVAMCGRSSDLFFNFAAIWSHVKENEEKIITIQDLKISKIRKSDLMWIL